MEPQADVYFSVTGQKDAPPRTQLHNFKKEMERVFYAGAPIPPLQSWEGAFGLLGEAIEHLGSARPEATVVVFLDELPWLATRRSGLLSALDHVWNTRLSRRAKLCVILCGSAASWILSKLIRAKGGLHNRITRQIRLEPFSLREARELLRSNGLKLAPRQVLEIYMAVGGVPYYLKQMTRGKSAAQNIGAACFSRSGILAEEFPRVLEALFTESATNEELLRVLAKKRCGMSRGELIKATRQKSGGRFASRLHELEEAGFIASFRPYGRKTKDTSYRLIDEYVWFYLSFIEKAPRGVLARGGDEYWVAKSTTPAYRAWAGYAFEGICLKHAQEIRKALGIAGLSVETANFRYLPGRGERTKRGAQIDLLFDREDGVITLCEIKYGSDDFRITKSYARDLINKIEVFEERTKTKKQILLALVTTHGMNPNAWSEDLIDNVVVAEDLFGET